MYIKNILLACTSLFFLSGCMEEAIQKSYNDMCNREPDSVMCSNQKVTGIDLGKTYLRESRGELYKSWTPKTDKELYGEAEYWTHNETIHEEILGDCEDVSMTFISQLILDGFSADRIKLVLSGTDGEVKHAYVRVSLEDGKEFTAFWNARYKDISYMQLDNVGRFTKY